jgi:uncharacterized protein YecE (DUF72 family)
MWSYAAWQGRFLPQPLLPRERLRAYASWCNAVEGNTTFYATPAKDTVASWAAQTSASFRFIPKMPRTVTHERRLGDIGEPMRAFLAAIEPLGTRAHALWVQLPPSFGPAGTFVNDTPGRWTPGGGDRCRVLPNALSDRLKSLKVRRAN